MPGIRISCGGLRCWRLGVLLVALSQGLVATGTGPKKITVSIPPQAWLVERIGHEIVEVTSLLTSGDSPATFQPTDSQTTEVLRSEVFFRIGVPFENGRWLEAIEATGRVPIVDTRKGIELRPVLATPSDDGDVQVEPLLGSEGRVGYEGLDPHIWLSPRLLEIQSRTVADEIGALDPTSSHLLRQNLNHLLTELDRLDRQLATQLAPYRGQTFMVFHPSWGYFADDYGLRQVAIEIEGKDPTDKELTRLQRLARDLGTRVIFVQPQIHGRAAEAVAGAIGAKVVEIDPLEPDVISNLQKVANLLVAGLAGAEVP